MRPDSIINRLYRFFYDGIKEMTIGKTLWLIIIIKLFIMFAILKPLFFPNLLKKTYDNNAQRSEHVAGELTKANMDD